LIMLIVVLNAVIGVIQESKAEKALDALKKLSSPNAKVIRDGEQRIVQASNVVPGDIVLVEAGDFVPADARILSSASLKVDESALTGESLPVEKHSGIITSDEHDADNMAFMETDVASGRGKGVVVEVGMGTEIGKIAEMIQEEEEDTPLQQKIARLGKTLGLLAVIVCSLVFVLGYLQGIEIVDNFMTAVSLAVAAVPEGFPAILSSFTPGHLFNIYD